MTAGQPTTSAIFRPQLLERRRRLEAAAATVSGAYLTALLAEVDAALQRIDEGSFGLCETCHDSIEPERLLADPLVRVCLDHLSEPERRALEGDLELATRIQARMLPPRELPVAGWDTHYHYEAAGPVSGDYCELVPLDPPGSLFFAVGDVAGKGVAASLLMTHLSAILRSLLSLGLPVPEVVSRANRLFCENTLASHYATLICGRVTGTGILELCNAGHCPPLAVGREEVRRVDVAGLPLGMFCQGEYASRRLDLTAGESLVLYSDGVTEASDPAGNHYGEERLCRVLRQGCGLDAQRLTAAVLEDLSAFRGDAAAADDLTLLILRRRP